MRASSARRPRARRPPPPVALPAFAALSGCVTTQSTLHPAGTEAEEIARLFWIMSGAGAVIWALVIGLAVLATLRKGQRPSEAFAEHFILIGGVILPSLLLGVLLWMGLRLLLGTGVQAADLRVHVRAEQFWWRVTYEHRGARIESANEVHLPAGQTVEVVLTSPDVIHSFWIPAIGGKMDAIAGRANVLRLTPTRAGRYRGVCAEFCGLSHALMAFDAEVHTPDAFAARLQREAQPASGAFLARRMPGLPRGARAGDRWHGRTRPDASGLAADPGGGIYGPDP